MGPGECRGFLDPVKVGDDGDVEGIAAALDRLVDGYPSLVEEPDARRGDQGPQPDQVARLAR